MHTASPRRLDDPDLVDAALLDDRLHPPAAGSSLGTGSAAALRGRMARFSGPEAHPARRERVDRLIVGIHMATVAEHAVSATRWYLGRVPAPLDVCGLAAAVPTVALAGALGWPNAESDALVSDVHSMAAAIGRGEPGGGATDAAVDRLLARAADYGRDPDAAVSLLYQNVDATKALLLAEAAAAVGGVRREPAVRQTVRVASVDAVVSAAVTTVEVRAGEVIQLNLEAGGREFGHGPHACPGRELAASIVDAVLGVLRRQTGLAAAVVERNAAGDIVEFQIG